MCEMNTDMLNSSAWHIHTAGEQASRKFAKLDLAGSTLNFDLKSFLGDSIFGFSKEAS